MQKKWHILQDEGKQIFPRKFIHNTVFILIFHRFPILFYKVIWLFSWFHNISYCLQPTTALIPTGEPIQLPKVVSPVHEHLPDYEVELVIVIGKDAKNVTEADALDYVLGYTGANDVSREANHSI